MSASIMVLRESWLKRAELPASLGQITQGPRVLTEPSTTLRFIFRAHGATPLAKFIHRMKGGDVGKVLGSR